MPKYELDETYFYHINSPEKAYWLGFIWCDAYVNSRRNTYEFKLGLSSKDDYHLEKLKRAISSTHEIKYYNISTGHKEARLYIGNKTFAGILYEEHEIQPHRPYADSIRHLIDEYMAIGYHEHEYVSHFMRGVLDADGCIILANKFYGATQRKEFSVGLTSQPVIVELFNKAILEEGLTETTYSVYVDSDNCHSLRITGNNKVESILDWIYKDCGDSMLDRKYSKYMFIKQYMENYRNERGEM